MWPALTLVVPKDIVGIALGFCTSLQNLGLVFFPLIVALIFTNSQSYDITLLFFLFIMILSLGLSIFVHIEDYKHNRVLHSVITQETPKKMNSSIIYKPIKTDKESLIDTATNDDEVRLLKIKELF